MPRFTLRFPAKDIPTWAAKYDYGDTEPTKIGKRAQSAHHLSIDDLRAMARWKTRTGRSDWLVVKNSDAYVREVTRHALASDEPRFKIEVLTVLDGVGWATASVILHFCDRERWPIIDVRALWSLSQPDDQTYDFDYWWAYTEYTRSLAAQRQVTMRTLDRALWKYSEQNQLLVSANTKRRRPSRAQG